MFRPFQLQYMENLSHCPLIQDIQYFIVEGRADDDIAVAEDTEGCQ